MLHSVFNFTCLISIVEGECKEYIGIHDVDAITSWLSDGTADSTDPVPAWRSPNSML